MSPVRRSRIDTSELAEIKGVEKLISQHASVMHSIDVRGSRACSLRRALLCRHPLTPRAPPAPAAVQELKLTREVAVTAARRINEVMLLQARHNVRNWVRSPACLPAPPRRCRPRSRPALRAHSSWRSWTGA